MKLFAMSFCFLLKLGRRKQFCVYLKQTGF
jgi:hypothetical protein